MIDACKPLAIGDADARQLDRENAGERPAGGEEDGGVANPNQGQIEGGRDQNVLEGDNDEGDEEEVDNIENDEQEVRNIENEAG